MFEGVMMALALVMGGISAYQQNQAAQQQNATASKGVADQEAAIKSQDTAEQQAQQQAQGHENQDAQWMYFKQLQSQSQGLQSQMPLGLAGAPKGAPVGGTLR